MNATLSKPSRKFSIMQEKKKKKIKALLAQNNVIKIREKVKLLNITRYGSYNVL